MKKRFRAEPYLAEAEATVVEVEGDWVRLDEALLFAFSGGQQSDRGTVAGHELLEAVEDDDGSIRYRLPEGHGLRVGERVLQAVDMELRRRVMRVHSATHVAYAALCEAAGEVIDLIGSNVHAGKGRLDWERDRPVTDLVPGASTRVDEVVGRDLQVLRYAEPGAGDTWTWELRGDDLDPRYWRMPCGGTHVARTGEIGKVKLKRKNIGAGKERVEITLSD